jgi:hypothetical protein
LFREEKVSVIVVSLYSVWAGWINAASLLT